MGAITYGPPTHLTPHRIVDILAGPLALSTPDQAAHLLLGLYSNNPASVQQFVQPDRLLSGAATEIHKNHQTTSESCQVLARELLKGRKLPTIYTKKERNSYKISWGCSTGLLDFIGTIYDHVRRTKLSSPQEPRQHSWKETVHLLNQIQFPFCIEGSLSFDPQLRPVFNIRSTCQVYNSFRKKNPPLHNNAESLAIHQNLLNYLLDGQPIPSIRIKKNPLPRHNIEISWRKSAHLWSLVLKVKKYITKQSISSESHQRKSIWEAVADVLNHFKLPIVRPTSLSVTPTLYFTSNILQIGAIRFRYTSTESSSKEATSPSSQQTQPARVNQQYTPLSERVLTNYVPVTVEDQNLLNTLLDGAPVPPICIQKNTRSNSGELLYKFSWAKSNGFLDLIYKTRLHLKRLGIRNNLTVTSDLLNRFCLPVHVVAPLQFDPNWLPLFNARVLEHCYRDVPRRRISS